MSSREESDNWRSWLSSQVHHTHSWSVNSPTPGWGPHSMEPTETCHLQKIKVRDFEVPKPDMLSSLQLGVELTEIPKVLIYYPLKRKPHSHVWIIWQMKYVCFKGIAETQFKCWTQKDVWGGNSFTISQPEHTMLFLGSATVIVECVHVSLAPAGGSITTI